MVQITDLEQARRIVGSRPEPPTEEELNEIYDETIEEPDAGEVDLAPFDDRPEATALRQLGDSYGLAAAVLRNSELVDNIDLRTEALRETIEGWGVMTVLMALEEDMFQELTEILGPVLPDIEDADQRMSVVEHLARLFIVLMMSVALNAEAGAVHHERILAGLLDDEEFMNKSANALFASMMYASLEFPKWPGRLATLIEKHGEHPMVREVVRVWATMEYHHGRLADGIRLELENVLVEITTPERASGGRDAVALRASQMAEIRDGLRQARTQSKWAESDAVAIEESEERDEGSDDDASDLG